MNKRVYVFFFCIGFIFTAYCWAQTEVGGTSSSSMPSPKVGTESTVNKPAASQSSSPLAVFRSLDQQTELLVKEVLDLSSDLAIIQEEEDNPANHQLLVLVTFDPTKLFTLDYIQLEVDNEVVAAYQYSENDLQALKRGAGHRLYVANLPAGMHEVFATMVGRIPRDPDYKSEVAYKFVSGVSRTVLELNVSSKTKGFPILAIKEWN